MLSCVKDSRIVGLLVDIWSHVGMKLGDSGISGAGRNEPEVVRRSKRWTGAGDIT